MAAFADVLSITTARRYYYLAKPGIIYGNCISAAAGFLLASGRHINWLLLATTLAGTALVIASGCVLNNVTDRHIDSLMRRTRRRALVTGALSIRRALVYALFLSLAGFSLLVATTNPLTVYAGVIGLYFYVIVYGYTKRRSPTGTLLGSVAGSTPILAGYIAANGRLDLTAALLFLVMACWQMPHFYAIALYRLDDYTAAKLPVLPAVKGISRTKQRIMSYILLYTVAVLALGIVSHLSPSFLIANLIMCAAWLWFGWRGHLSTPSAFSAPSSRQSARTKPWARTMFRYSLVAMVVLSTSLALNAWL